MLKGYYFDENKVFPHLDETAFENRFFGYNPDEDPNGSRGMRLADEAFFRAKKEKLPIEVWIVEHRMLYHSRNNRETAVS